MILKHYFSRIAIMMLSLKNQNKTLKQLDDTSKTLDDKTPTIAPLECDGAKFVDTQPSLLLEDDKEEVKEGKGINIFTSSKVVPRLLLTKIKAGNNSYTLKKEIREIQ